MIITEVESTTAEAHEIMKKPSKSYTICLNMIVKNESHIIAQTLENICGYIDFDAYFISDTGSTDDTIEIIRTFFKKRNIPGHIEQVEWRDFGFNRTLALQMAFNKTDYLFIFDADDSIHGDFRMPRELIHDAYQFKLGQMFVYLRTLIVNNRKRWKFVGVLHEYITCVDKEESTCAVQGNYYIESGRSGSRSQDPQKYIKDASILECGFHEESKNGADHALAERYAFYCAQSWMDAGPAYIDKAIEWYIRVLSQNNWPQEKYYSALCLGDLYNKKGDKYNSLKYYCKTMEYDEERIEGIASAMEILRADGNHVMVNALYHKYKNYNKFPQNKLFITIDKYHDLIEYNNSISAFYISDKRSGYECCKTILRDNIMSYYYLRSTYSNFIFYRNFFEEDSFEEILRLFYVVDHFLSVIASKNDTYSDNDIDTWSQLYAKVKHVLVAPCVLLKVVENSKSDSDDFYLARRPIDKLLYLDETNQAENPSIVVIKRRLPPPPPCVIITFTTCKRLDLFQQTVNSILNTWTDVEMIDYWYCVDDNSSEADREIMRTLYPWIDYHMKTPHEKGHRRSMNIIWDKLNELKPAYWIHMEDDFLFHTPGSYIQKAKQMMEDSQNLGYNVRQILYNRNYGETVIDYRIQGHRLLRRMTHEVALHEHKAGGGGGGGPGGNFEYKNCHYWPHYSFRPSLIDVSAILAAGNYDTPNQFFEMDYANKWTNLGYMSGFYNQITNQHIGRLTTERGDQSIPNAYVLNDESQFVAPVGGGGDGGDGDGDASITTHNAAVSTPKKKRYLTSIPFYDGFGAQFQRFIWTCIYAEEYEDAEYIYRTPTKIAHNYTDDPQFIDKLEDVMNMKPYYLNYDKMTEGMGNDLLTPDFYDIFNYVEKHIDQCMKSKSMDRIKEHYWQNKNRVCERLRVFRIPEAAAASTEYTHHLAVHIRRPNCEDTRPNSGEEYTNEYYLMSLLMIRDTYIQRNPVSRIQYHVYSQGTDDKFAELCNNKVIGHDVILHLNDTTEDTFIAMTLADILVTSPSSYSYTAAFFCDGDVYYTDFWHKPCSWWNKLENPNS
jgi:hypothetical protein